MKKKRIQKGEFGYLPYEKKVATIRTVIMFVMALIIFFTGYFWTKTKANVFSIIAVLALLPASRSLVNMIMYYRAPQYMEEIKNSVDEIKGNVTVLYQLYLTSYQKNFPVSCFAVKGNHLIGYTEFEKCDLNACEQHIKDLLVQNALKNVTVKIFRERERFEERIQQLQNIEVHKQDEEIISLIKDISL